MIGMKRKTLLLLLLLVPVIWLVAEDRLSPGEGIPDTPVVARLREEADKRGLKWRIVEVNEEGKTTYSAWLLYPGQTLNSDPAWAYNGIPSRDAAAQALLDTIDPPIKGR
jgi:hypothetical protein